MIFTAVAFIAACSSSQSLWQLHRAARQSGAEIDCAGTASRHSLEAAFLEYLLASGDQVSFSA
jgi:hypothetical protein